MNDTGNHWKRIGVKIWESLLLLMGIILPVIALLAELFTGMSAGLCFDPLPTPLHAVLVGLVPVCNWLAWMGLRRGWTTYRTPLTFALGAAAGISLLYALLYLPVTPFALIAVVTLWWYLGFGLVGLLPLSPLLAFVTGLVFRRRLVRRYFVSSPAEPGRPAFGLGVGAGLLIILLAFSGEIITLVGLRWAARGTPGQQEKGIALLRQTSRHDLILRAGQGNDAMYDDVLLQWVLGGRHLDAAQARRLYYRVTGTDALQVKPRGGEAGLLGRGRGREEFDWDSQQGGTVVGGILRDLTLDSSRLDGTVDGETGVGYLEWTLVFRNDASRRREARAMVALPPGAVVTRLTLWVRGEEREAAFGPRGKARAAYEKVVQARRDPVLVTTCGPDRLLVQCFPVEGNGGEMKVRLGMTVPLQPGDEMPLRWSLRLPLFLERNFKLDPGDRHEIWIDSASPLKAVNGSLGCTAGPDGGWSARGRFLEADLWNSDATLVVQGKGDGSVVRRDVLGEKPAVIRQSLADAAGERPRSVVLVLDGSASMRTACTGVVEALHEAFPEELRLAVMRVGDGAAEAPKLRVADRQRVREMTGAIDGADFAGGRCGVRFLEAAWDVLSREPGPAAIIWVHGPQPVTLDNPDGLIQRMERQPGAVRLYALQVGAGADKLAEALDAQEGVTVLPPVSDPAAPLASLFRKWEHGAAPLKVVRIREEGAAAESLPASDHLARLWARQEIALLMATGLPKNRLRAGDVGARYRVVSPASGAVVLETDREYREAGLDQPPADHVPTVPEPEFYILAILAVATVVYVWKRQPAPSA